MKNLILIFLMALLLCGCAKKYSVKHHVKHRVKHKQTLCPTYPGSYGSTNSNRRVNCKTIALKRKKMRKL